eukprot:5705169-Ditylum_brightwellii.AAC.1
MQNQETLKHLPTTAICDALKITMRYNVFTFGDSHWLQILGAAMGTPLAPTYAQTTFGTHKTLLLKCFILRLLLYCCYIDNAIGIWVPPDDPTKEETEWRVFRMLINM